MGGKAAEILIFGAANVTNGAFSDIQHATGLATAMVSQWGMSDKLGNINYTATQESYLGNQSSWNASAESRRIIDEEVRRLTDEAFERATKILEAHKEEFENLAQGLLEYETLTGEDMMRVIRGEKPLFGKEDDTPKPPAGGAPSVTAIPKTKPRAPKGGLEPEPSA